MNRSLVPNLQSRKSTPQMAPSDGLPRWEQLPRQRQHELIITLAATLVKQLSGRTLSTEGNDE